MKTLFYDSNYTPDLTGIDKPGFRVSLIDHNPNPIITPKNLRNGCLTLMDLWGEHRQLYSLACCLGSWQHILTKN